MDKYISKYAVYIIIDDKEVYIDGGSIEYAYFIEDIFSYSIVGKMEFHDRQGIMEFGPLTGNEKIGIIYGVDEEIEKKFYIYKINRVIPSWANANTKENYLEVIFVDEMFYNLTNREYSISWKNKKGSQIISDITKNMLGVDSFEKWEDSVDIFDYFYIPYWTPKKSVDWISKRCKGALSRQSGYLFYNTVAGSNFITMDQLLNQTELMELGFDRSGFYTFGDKSKIIYNQILGYEMSGIDNLSRLDLRGGIRYGYDFNRKKLINKSYKYTDGISKYTLLGERSLFGDISDSDVRHTNFGEDTEQIVDNIYYNNWVKSYSMQQTLSITVHGHEQRYAGGLIEVEWPSAHEKEVYNKNLAGKYLVKSITHQFGGGQPFYKQKMILIKNAYEGSDNIDLIKAQNKNLGSYKVD